MAVDGGLGLLESMGVVVEHGGLAGGDAAVIDFVALLSGGGGQRFHADREFTAEGGGDFHHGIQGEIGIAAQDLGDVGGRGADFLGQGGAGEAAGFHEDDEILGKADGYAFRPVDVGAAGLLGFGFEGGEIFHGGGGGEEGFSRAVGTVCEEVDSAGGTGLVEDRFHEEYLTRGLISQARSLGATGISTGRPHTPLPLRDLRAAHLLDGTGMEMPGSVVGGVDRGLARADVVGPDRVAGVLHALRDQAAAREEIDEGGKEWFQ